MSIAPQVASSVPSQRAPWSAPPTIICIGGDLDAQLTVLRVLDGIGTMVFAPDSRSAAQLLHEHEQHDADSAKLSDGAIEPRGRGSCECVGDLEIDHDRHVLHCGGTQVGVTSTELEVLRCLSSVVGAVWSHERLHSAVWHTDSLGDHGVLHSAIKRLRRKLRQVGTRVEIESVRAVGFRLRWAESLPTVG